jgi:hypothetical protein
LATNNEERLKAILAQQDLADQAKAASEVDAANQEKVEKAQRTEIKKVWVGKLRPSFLAFIELINASMKGGRKLYVIPGNLPDNALLVDEISFSFENKAPSLIRTKCSIAVNQDGKILVRSTDANGRPSKTYNFEAHSVEPETLEAVALDFIEANI